MYKNAVSSRRNCVDTELHASVNDIIRCKEPCPVSVNAHLAKLILTVRQHNGKSIRNNARHVIILAHSALRDARVENGNRENHRHYKKHKTPLPHKNTINLFHVANLVNLSTQQTRKTKFFNDIRSLIPKCTGENPLRRHITAFAHRLIRHEPYKMPIPLSHAALFSPQFPIYRHGKQDTIFRLPLIIKNTRHLF